MVWRALVSATRFVCILSCRRISTSVFHQYGSWDNNHVQWMQSFALCCSGASRAVCVHACCAFTDSSLKRTGKVSMTMCCFCQRNLYVSGGMPCLYVECTGCDPLGLPVWLPYSPLDPTVLCPVCKLYPGAFVHDHTLISELTLSQTGVKPPPDAPIVLLKKRDDDCRRPIAA